MHSQTWYKNGENILCTKMQSVGFHLTYKWTTFYINKVFNSKFDALLFKTVFFIHRGTPNARFWGKLSPCKDICKRVIERQHHKKPHDNIIKWKQFPRYWLLWEESTGHRWIPLTKENDVELWCFLFFVKRLSKQSTRQWFETLSRSLWRHCNGISVTCARNEGNVNILPWFCKPIQPIKGQYIYIYMVV